jgi:hypothetical protein
MLPRRTRRPASLERKGEDEGEVCASLHCRFDNPTDAVQEHGTYWGTKAEPLGVGALAALLFEQAVLDVFDLDQRRRLRSCCWIMSRASVAEDVVVFFSNRLRPLNWWPFFKR